MLRLLGVQVHSHACLFFWPVCHIAPANLHVPGTKPRLQDYSSLADVLLEAKGCIGVGQKDNSFHAEAVSPIEIIHKAYMTLRMFEKG